MYELISSASELPTPEGWEKKTTADGRIYFDNNGKTTVAYNPDGELINCHRHPGFDKLYPKPAECPPGWSQGWWLIRNGTGEYRTTWRITGTSQQQEGLPFNPGVFWPDNEYQ